MDHRQSSLILRSWFESEKPESWARSGSLSTFVLVLRNAYDSYVHDRLLMSRACDVGATENPQAIYFW